MICGPLDSVSSILWDLCVFWSFIRDLNIRSFLGKTVVSYIKSDELMCVCVCLVTQSCPALCNPMHCSLPGYSVHGDSSGQNIGVGCHFILQGIFPTQGLNPGLPHCRQTLYPLSPQGNRGDAGGSTMLMADEEPTEIQFPRGAVPAASYTTQSAVSPAPNPF